MQVIVKFSGGKDSTVMLLEMIERGERIDKIVFHDTLLEFHEMYEYVALIERLTGRKVIIT